MMQEWFIEWFNTEEYLKVYKYRNENDAECHIRFLLSQIILPTNASILDIACGSGRHSILLAKRGYKVTGVDLSKRLLIEANLAAQRENLNIEFIEADIRNFNSDKKFDLVLNLFTSFGYFETDEENFLLFQKAYALLNSGSYFVFDYFNKTYLINNLVPYSEESDGNYSILQERKIVDDRVIKRINIRKNGSSKIYFESVKLYDSKLLICKLKQIGFEIVKLFGDFSGKDYEENSSPRFIAICKKI